MYGSLTLMAYAAIAYLAEEPGVESGDVWRHDALVHVIELRELGAAGKALLHQIQHRRHTCNSGGCAPFIIHRGRGGCSYFVSY